jgi:hypothetical protein
LWFVDVDGPRTVPPDTMVVAVSPLPPPLPLVVRVLRICASFRGGKEEVFIKCCLLGRRSRSLLMLTLLCCCGRFPLLFFVLVCDSRTRGLATVSTVSRLRLSRDANGCCLDCHGCFELLGDNRVEWRRSEVWRRGSCSGCWCHDKAVRSKDSSRSLLYRGVLRL